MIDAQCIDTPIQRRTVISTDGTPIAVYIAGNGSRDLVLAPGLGANILCWKYILEGFKDVYRMVTWDPRGTYDSGSPRDERDLDMPHHVHDLESIVAALNLENFVLAGWSMGVQISLEYTIRHPDRVLALALINGHYGNLLGDVLDLTWARPLFRSLVGALRMVSPAVKSVAPPVLRSTLMTPLLAYAGVLREPVALFPAILERFSHLDFHRYIGMIALLDQHSTGPSLSRIRVPTIITAGTKDFLTPPSVGFRMQKAIRGAELVLLEGGTHYAMMELPGELHAVMESFFRRVDPKAFAAAR